MQEAAALEATPAPALAVLAETTPSEAAKPAEVSAQSAPPAEELKTVKLTVNGEEIEVTEADLKAGHMRHRDYTQKTQQLADERKAVAQEKAQWAQEKAAIAQEMTAIDQFLQDQTAVDAYYEKAFGVQRGQQLQMPQIDPNKPVTAADVAEISRYNAEQVRVHLERQSALARQEALKAQALVLESQRAGRTASAEADIHRHVTGILDKYPVLKKFDGIEEYLYGEAARYMPTDRAGTIEDAKQRLSEAADRRMAVMRSIADDEKKQVAVHAAQLKRNSTEAPGGTAPARDPGKKLTLNSRDRKEFLKAAEADLRAIMEVG